MYVKVIIAFFTTEQSSGIQNLQFTVPSVLEWILCRY